MEHFYTYYEESSFVSKTTPTNKPVTYLFDLFSASGPVDGPCNPVGSTLYA